MSLGALANLGVGIAGLAGAFDPNKPPDRNLLQEAQQYFQVLPQLLAAQQTYTPQFSQLYNAVLRQSLLGQPAGAPQTTAAHEVFVKTGEAPPAGSTFLRAAPGTSGPTPLQPGQRYTPDQLRTLQHGASPGSYYQVPTITTPGAAAKPGQLDLYEQVLPRLTALQNQQSQAQLGSAVQSYGLYGPQVKQAFSNTFPEYSNLLDTLLGQAQQDASAGYGLAPLEKRQLEQNIRGSFSARGLGTGPGAANTEALQETLGGEAMRQSRLQNAAKLSALYGASVPTLSLPNIGAPLASSPAASGLFSSGTGAIGYGSQQFGTPFNGYSANLYDTNLGLNWDYQKTLAAIRAQAANQTAQGSASLLSSLAGSGFGGGGLGGAAG